MKKWHMEGIVSCGNNYGRKVIVPDEDHMYRRVHAYLLRTRKESAVVELLRKGVGRILRSV